MNYHRLLSCLLFSAYSSTVFASAFNARLDENQQIIVFTPDGPMSSNGFDFISSAGLLVPTTLGFASGTDMDAVIRGEPFLLANTSNQVTIGAAGQGLLLDGEYQTGIGYTGDLTSGDLVAQYGDGSTPRPLPFLVGDTLIVGTGPKPTSPPVSSGNSGTNSPNNPAPTLPENPEMVSPIDLGNEPDSSVGSSAGSGNSNAVPEPTALLTWFVLGALCLAAKQRSTSGSSCR